MNRPTSHVAPLTPPHISRRIAVAVAGVIVIHAAVVYALLTGLAGRIVREIPRIIEVEVIKPPPLEKVSPVPPPPKPALQAPNQPVVPPPVITIRVPPSPHAVTAVKHKLAPPRPIVTAPPAPAIVKPPVPPPVLKPAPVPPTPVHAISATHTIPPYPPLARRLGQEGSVLLALTVGPDGHVVNAMVVSSSGHSALDRTAVDWVKSHWRYRPATQNGHPVAARIDARIVFNLSSAA